MAKKIDLKTVRPVLGSSSPKSADPPRYPSIIDPLESEIMDIQKVNTNSMILSISKSMAKMKK